MNIRQLFNQIDYAKAFHRRAIKELDEIAAGNSEPKFGATWMGIWYFHHKDKDGNTLWKSIEINALGHEGSNSILDGYFRAASIPTNLYIRMYNDTPVNTDHLSDLASEASGNGYDPATDGVLARSAVGWPTLAAQGAPNTHYKLSSATCTFAAASGSWGPVTYAILASASTGTSGILLGFVALSQSRTLNDGDTMDISVDIALQ